MIFEIGKFGKFLEFSKLGNEKTYRIFFNLENKNLVPKIDKFRDCSSIRYSALLAIFSILIFAL